MRTLNDPMLRSVLMRNSDVTEITLVTFTVPGYPVAYLARNNVLITSRGNDYLPIRMSIQYPDEEQYKEVTGRIIIDNVSQLLVAQIRATFGGIPTRLEQVLSSDVDTVVIGPYDLVGRNISIDQLTISMDLLYEDILNQAFPADRVTPITVPAMFSLAAITKIPST